MTEEKMKRKLYELYQLDWMLVHGYGLPDIIKGMNDHEAVDHDSYIHKDENGDSYADVDKIFLDWEDVGFGGSLYVCFDEFCDAELTEVEYMKSLLARAILLEGYEELEETYDEWVKKNGIE